MLDKDLAEIYYKDIQDLLVQPRELKIVDKGNKLTIFAFDAKFVSRIYGICMINMWLSKKKGSTFFDMMTMSDIAYAVAVLENCYEVLDQEYNKKKMSRTEWELYMKSGDYAITNQNTQIKRARRGNIANLG
jgi:hypothetical protein